MGKRFCSAAKLQQHDNAITGTTHALYHSCVCRPQRRCGSFMLNTFEMDDEATVLTSLLTALRISFYVNDTVKCMRFDQIMSL